MESLGSSEDRAVGFEPMSVAGSTPAQATCTRCDATKSEEDFAWRNKMLGKRQRVCRSCQSELSKAHYEGNKSDYLGRNERRRQTVMEYVENWKDQPCADCGHTYPPKVMDAHHLEEEAKEEIISRLQRSTTLPKVIRELAKCIPLCANCHRLRTFYTET